VSAYRRRLALVLTVTVTAWAAGGVFLAHSALPQGVFAVCAGTVILASGLAALRPRDQITLVQWFRLPKAERKHRLAGLRAAAGDLQDNRYAEYLAGIDEETERDRKLSDDLDDLQATVPWWRRR